MNPNEAQLARLEEKLNALTQSVEKTRKYLLTLIIIMVASVALPILMALVMVPIMMNSLGSVYGI